MFTDNCREPEPEPDSMTGPKQGKGNRGGSRGEGGRGGEGPTLFMNWYRSAAEACAAPVLELRISLAISDTVSCRNLATSSLAPTLFFNCSSVCSQEFLAMYGKVNQTFFFNHTQ